MPKEKRELILDRFEESGMTGQAFGKHVGVKHPTFASWAQKRRRQRGVEHHAKGAKNGNAVISLFETVVSAPPLGSSARLELQSVGGTRIRLKPSEQIKKAL